MNRTMAESGKSGHALAARVAHGGGSTPGAPAAAGEAHCPCDSIDGPDPNCPHHGRPVRAMDLLREAQALLTNTGTFDQGAPGEWSMRRLALVPQIDAAIASQADRTPPGAPAAGSTADLRAGLQLVRKFIEYARYVLEPGVQQPFDQFPRQDAADKAMAKLDVVLAALASQAGAQAADGKEQEL